MPDITVIYDVPVVAQTQTMSCWAAAAASLLGWKTGDALTEQDVVQQAGPLYEADFAANTGLDGPDVSNFAAALGLAVEAPQNWDPQGYANLLQTYGPLWVGCALTYQDVLYGHARVLRGLIGDGTFDGTTAYIIDPAGGNSYEETLQQFATEMETIAQQDLPDGSDLNPQVIHVQ